MAEIIVWIISAGAVISLLIAFVRLLTAETEVDRVVSLDIVFSSGVALTGRPLSLKRRVIFSTSALL